MDRDVGGDRDLRADVDLGFNPTWAYYLPWSERLLQVARSQIMGGPSIIPPGMAVLAHAVTFGYINKGLW